MANNLSLHLQKSVPFAKTPIPRPVVPHLIDVLETKNDTYKPSEGGYTLDLPGMRSKAKQERMTMLFYARYLNISDKEFAAAIGVARSSVDSDEEYTASVEHLNGMMKTMRERTFGEHAFLNRLVQHTVEEFDFQSTLFNISLEEKCLKSAPQSGETAAERVSRLREHSKYVEAQKEHIARRVATHTSAITDAGEKLNALYSRRGVSPKSKIEEAERVIRHHRKIADDWKPLILVEELSPLQTPPLPQPMYSQLTLECQQMVWSDLWSKNIATTILWELRDVIDIPATLAVSEHIYSNAFINFCMDSWKLCIGPGEDANRSTVYENLGQSTRQSFSEDVGEGLDMLRIANSASLTPSKRKTPPSWVPPPMKFKRIRRD